MSAIAHGRKYGKYLSENAEKMLTANGLFSIRLFVLLFLSPTWPEFTLNRNANIRLGPKHFVLERKFLEAYRVFLEKEGTPAPKVSAQVSNEPTEEEWKKINTAQKYLSLLHAELIQLGRNVYNLYSGKKIKKDFIPSLEENEKWEDFEKYDAFVRKLFVSFPLTLYSITKS